MARSLRGPKSPEGGGFAAAHPLARRAGYGAAPPAPRLLRIACGDGLRPALTPETTAAPGARKSGQAQACPPRCTRRANPAAAGPQKQAGRQDTGEPAFDSQKERENYKPRVVSRIK